MRTLSQMSTLACLEKDILFKYGEPLEEHSSELYLVYESPLFWRHSSAFSLSSYYGNF